MIRTTGLATMDYLSSPAHAALRHASRPI